MKLTKLLTTTTILTAISLTSLNTYAGLTVCSKNYPHWINIYCAGSSHASPAPIPPSPNKTACASLFGHQDIPWAAIVTTIFGGKLEATCIFKSGKTMLGIATLRIAPGFQKGEITGLGHTAGYSVDLHPGIGKFYTEIKVTIAPN